MQFLVIGYGNELRGDDAVGRLAAAAVADWHLPGVQVLSVHQLAPELAEPLAAAECALFLDAHSASDSSGILIRRLSPSTTAPDLGHAADPTRLLAWAERLFGRAPASWWITIPAADFSFGAPLSSHAQLGLTEALAAIHLLLQRDGSAQASRQTNGPPGAPRPGGDPGC